MYHLSIQVCIQVKSMLNVAPDQTIPTRIGLLCLIIIHCCPKASLLYYKTGVSGVKIIFLISVLKYEPRHEKTNILVSDRV